MANGNTLLELRRFPLVEVPGVKIRRIDFDGFDDDSVLIVGSKLQCTLWKLMQPLGFSEPVRAPVAVMTRPLAGHIPGYFDMLLEEARRRLQCGNGLLWGEVPLH